MTHELNPQPPDQHQNPRVPLVRLGPGGDFTNGIEADEHEGEKADGFDATLYRLVRLGVPLGRAASMIDRHGCDAINHGLDNPRFETLDNGSGWRVHCFPPGEPLSIPRFSNDEPTPYMKTALGEAYNPCGCGVVDDLREAERLLAATPDPAAGMVVVEEDNPFPIIAGRLGDGFPLWLSPRCPVDRYEEGEPWESWLLHDGQPPSHPAPPVSLPLSKCRHLPLWRSWWPPTVIATSDPTDPAKLLGEWCISVSPVMVDYVDRNSCVWLRSFPLAHTGPITIGGGE